MNNTCKLRSANYQTTLNTTIRGFQVGLANSSEKPQKRAIFIIAYFFNIVGFHTQPPMATPDASQGVSNCYLFKSRLQEFAQKVGYSTPVYETIRGGPSHEPCFRSTVIVNHVRYDSLPGFYNSKAAEQSAAEVALLELSQLKTMAECMSQPVHETGLCKNLLQEYAQKMNYAIPVYRCQIVESPGRVSMFSCTVETGGMKYIGAAARTKKEAEIKAARTALLAIQADVSQGDSSNGDSVHTVVPCKKKVADLGIKSKESAAALKPKKRHYKKKSQKKKHAAVKGNLDQNKNNGSLMVCAADKVETYGTNDSATKATDFGVSLAEVTDLKCEGCFTDAGAASIPCCNGDLNPDNNPPNLSDGECSTDVGAASIPHCNGDLDPDNNPPNFSDGGCFADVGAASIPEYNGDSNPDTKPPNFSDGLGSFVEEVNEVH